VCGPGENGEHPPVHQLSPSVIGHPGPAADFRTSLPERPAGTSEAPIQPERRRLVSIPEVVHLQDHKFRREFRYPSVNHARQFGVWPRALQYGLNLFARRIGDDSFGDLPGSLGLRHRPGVIVTGPNSQDAHQLGSIGHECRPSKGLPS
jgi:hypothetical protein